MKYIISIILFFFAMFPLYAGTKPLQIYREAYELEKKYPVLATGLYEEALAMEPDEKLKHTILGRLYFLYAKTDKYAPFFQMRKKYASLPFIRHDNKMVKQLASSLQVFPEEVQSIADACLEKNVEKVKEGLKKQNNNRQFHLFVLSLITENPDSVFLNQLYQDDALYGLFPENRIILMIKSEDKRALGMIYQNMQENASDADKGKFLYLLGMHLRAKKKNLLSSRFFMMSSSYANEYGGTNEAAKSLIATGRFQEACSLPIGPYREYSESDILLKLFCEGKLKRMKNTLRFVLENLYKKEKFKFYAKLAGAYE